LIGGRQGKKMDGTEFLNMKPRKEDGLEGEKGFSERGHRDRQNYSRTSEANDKQGAQWD
jgi:hypothetical protein